MRKGSTAASGDSRADQLSDGTWVVLKTTQFSNATPLMTTLAAHITAADLPHRPLQVFQSREDMFLIRWSLADGHPAGMM